MVTTLGASINLLLMHTKRAGRASATYNFKKEAVALPSVQLTKGFQ